jgi:hypothetical protein
MSEIQLTLPALFGDHHTVAVCNILDKLDGVEGRYVTSAFRQVVVKFDPHKTSEEAIRQSLAKEGYREGELEETLPLSSPEVSTRHSASIAETFSFTNVAPSWQGRPLWPCPGFEYKSQMED